MSSALESARITAARRYSCFFRRLRNCLCSPTSREYAGTSPSPPVCPFFPLLGSDSRRQRGKRRASKPKTASADLRTPLTLRTPTTTMSSRPEVVLSPIDPSTDWPALSRIKVRAFDEDPAIVLRAFPKDLRPSFEERVGTYRREASTSARFFSRSPFKPRL
jgi:hypothetical protein